MEKVWVPLYFILFFHIPRAISRLGNFGEIHIWILYYILLQSRTWKTFFKRVMCLKVNHHDHCEGVQLSQVEDKHKHENVSGSFSSKSWWILLFSLQIMNEIRRIYIYESIFYKSLVIYWFIESSRGFPLSFYHFGCIQLIQHALSRYFVVMSF